MAQESACGIAPELLMTMDSGALLLCATARLERSLAERYAQARRGEGRGDWLYPAILAWMRGCSTSA